MARTVAGVCRLPWAPAPLHTPQRFRNVRTRSDLPRWRMAVRRKLAVNYSLAVILPAVSLAACTPMTPARSSSAVLAPEMSWVIVAKPAQPAALDVARSFQARGYALVDFQQDDR